jgi:pyruvate/2-oxoglutarate dehydrogenase complex dihydrolipoamide dehydrogenase (E3) component
MKKGIPSVIPLVCFYGLALLQPPWTVFSFTLSSSSMVSKNNNPEVPRKTYDLIVIGGGSAGLTAAKFAATFGKSSVIIEKAKVGGDCTWSGCVPSKSLLASAKASHAVSNNRRARELGIVQWRNYSAPAEGTVAPAVVVDMKAVKNRVDENIRLIYNKDDSPEALKKLGIDVISGMATFVDSKTVNVCSIAEKGGEEGQGMRMVCRAKDGVLIATGARPKRPNIAGIENVDYITYEQVFQLEQIPRTMTVIGGGPIGCELAQAYARLGSKVTVVASSLLSREEPEVGELMQRVFEVEGIQVTKSRAINVMKKEGTCEHLVTCQDGQQVTGEILLCATGRVPTVDGMNLKELGVELNEYGGFKTDKTLQTTVKGLYAAGDCTGDRQFTHYAGYQGAVGARNILLPLTDPGVMDHVPATTFTDPEVSSVGLTEKEAREKFGDQNVSVAFRRLCDTDRGVCEGNQEGFIKIVYQSRGYKILGATIASPVGGELISEISVAMKTGLTFDMLATVMHTYPSHSFTLQAMAAEVYYNKLVKSKRLLNFLKWLGL